MPRYFLNVRHGMQAVIVDPEGDEAIDLDAIHAHALRVGRDLILRAHSVVVRDWFTCTFEITNAESRLLLTVPFGADFVNAPEAAER